MRRSWVQGKGILQIPPTIPPLAITVDIFVIRFSQINLIFI